MFLRNAPEIPAGRKRKAPSFCPSAEGSLGRGNFYPTEAYKDDDARGTSRQFLKRSQDTAQSVERALRKLEGGCQCYPKLISLISLCLNILKLNEFDIICYTLPLIIMAKMGPKCQDKEASLVRSCHVESAKR